MLATTKQYADAARGVAASLNVPHADVFTQIQKIKDWQTTALDSDGVHLSTAGNKVVYDSVMYVINNALKPIRCAQLLLSANAAPPTIARHY